MVGAAASLATRAAGLPKSKITKIRYYKTPTDAAGRPNVRQPLFNQSTNVVIVETDTGLIGVGEGGAGDTMEQCASMLIGEDPFRTDRIWQMMYRGYFYPPGREKVHGLGALDMALWDIKGKALGVPVYELLGGLTREAGRDDQPGPSRLRGEDRGGPRPNGRAAPSGSARPKPGPLAPLARRGESLPG